MGRQVNFYFESNDEKHFLRTLDSKNVVFLKFTNIKYLDDKVYNDITLHPISEASHPQTCICLKKDINMVKYVNVEKTGFYFVNDITSPVIEFTRSSYNKDLNLLVSGRLWFQMKYWTEDEEGNDVLLSKSKELEKLYNSLAGWIRRHCKRLPNGNYIGPHAMELYKKGAELSP